MSHLAHFREEIDHFMKNHPSSPLDHHQRLDFGGLEYYEPDANLLFEVNVERFSKDEPIVVMQTSTGDSQDYRRWGKISLEVEGEMVTLTIFSDALEQDFFMPFKDSSNGADTYGAGRYMDNHRPGLTLLGTNRLELDFNYAYNPYCAYSVAYSCPLPPRENWLKVPIRAGEKIYR